MTGESAALATAILWTITAITFEYAGKRIGALALNFLRLAVGAIFLGFYGLLVHGSFIPFDASLPAWLWLGASGLIGLVLGDLLLFQSFIDLGARFSMLVYALAPAFTALLGYLVLGESLDGMAFAGMGLTLGGIALAVLGRPSADATAKTSRRLWRGLAVALLATLCQAGGLILSKVGAPTMDAFSGTQIRVLVGVLAFGLVLLATGRGRGVLASLRDGRAALSLVAGSFFGPFLGVSLSLAAIQTANAGVASSIMSLVPILIILPSVILFKERVSLLEVLGAGLAVGGTVLLFI
jgi:drug/metabolite transporter (DMT)-like permease